MRILLATTNLHKLREYQALFRLTNHDIISLSDLYDFESIIEDQVTIKANAIKKAQYYASKHQLLTLADDSGLCVKALNGLPGVYSSRYSGLGDQVNINKLLVYLANQTDRSAYFETTIALASPHGLINTYQGFCDGVITTTLLGSNGFGYDPVFFVPHLGKTFAQMTASEKNQHSHRARAFLKLNQTIQNDLDQSGFTL